MELLAASAEYASASRRRLGPAALRGRGHARRSAARRSRGDVAAQQARSGRIRAAAGATGRHSAAARPRRQYHAGRIATPADGGAARLGDGECASPADLARVRGPALGRSDDARPDARPRRARRAGPAIGRRDDTARIPCAVGRALASRDNHADAARSASGREHGCGTGGQARSVSGHRRGRLRAHRRRAALRRGSDAAVIGERRAGRDACDPVELSSNP